jgi:SAM-dependent methyltransferase
MIWHVLSRLAGAPSRAAAESASHGGTAPGSLTPTGPTDTYILPRTRQEQDRLDLQHFALRQLLGTPFLAPVQHPRAILDVGCGTGLWLREAAHRWPHARLVALDKDLSLLRLPPPPHCQLFQVDLLAGLPFPDASFDYVHQRLLGAAIPLTAWPGVLEDLVRVTRPGGWLEVVEATDRMANEGPRQAQVRQWLERLAARRGLHLEAPLEVPEWLRALGLEPEVQPFRAPLFGKRQGAPLFRRDLQAALRSVAPMLARLNQVPLEQVEEMLRGLPGEWEQYRTAGAGLAVWARRPWERRGQGLPQQEGQGGQP